MKETAYKEKLQVGRGGKRKCGGSECLAYLVVLAKGKENEDVDAARARATMLLTSQSRPKKSLARLCRWLDYLGWPPRPLAAAQPGDLAESGSAGALGAT